jgi:RHS repeat-associated protein
MIPEPVAHRWARCGITGRRGHRWPRLRQPSPSVNYATDLSIHIRDLPLQELLYEYDAQGGLVERSRTTHEYDNHVPDGGHARLVERADIFGLDISYQNPDKTTRGNRTRTERWLDLPGDVVTTYRQYDVAGNVVKTIDPRGHAMLFDLNDRYGAPDGSARTNTPPPELGQLKSYALASSSQNPKGHTTYTQSDYYLARPVDHEGANTSVSSFTYADALDRPTEVLRAQASRTRFEYQDAPPNPLVRSKADKDLLNDGKLRTEAVFDSLGREVATRIFESDTQFIVTGGKTYDGAGRVRTVFNPYRLTDPPPFYATTTLYDGLDRPTLLLGPDSTTTRITYFGRFTTTTDPALKVRRTEADALGRTVAVVEDPSSLNHLTTYQYDAFDNVVRVLQGSQERTFAYDSLSRLICAATPESRVGAASCATLPAQGVTRYGYDRSGNLLSRTDPRGVSSFYGYDELDRVTGRSYSDGTPAVGLGYDEAVNGKGRLYYVASTIQGQAWGTAHDAYDALGRVTHSRQTSAGADYRFEYTYDLADNLRTQKYPSGRVVTTAYDVAGRPRTVGEGSMYAYGDVPLDSDYAPHGALQSLKLGVRPAAPGVQRWRQDRFNCRLQQRSAGLGSSASQSEILAIDLRHGTTNNCQDDPELPSGNNGNLLKQLIVVNGALRFTQNFTYDGANRLATATEAGVWSQTYGYDRWGNRAVTAGLALEPDLTPTSLGHFDTATNRIRQTSTPISWTYDDAGNLTRDGRNRSFTYDAENRQTGAANTTYLYDGNGRRVRKTVGGSSTLYVHDAFGRLAAEYGPVNATLGMTRFVIADHLGSTRLTVDEKANVITRNDYLPFGEEVPPTAQYQRADYGADQTVRHRFTGKERDIETGLDYFEARYNSGPQGRFSSGDPLFGFDSAMVEPQLWNRYSYVGNNPLTYVDRDGLEREQARQDSLAKGFLSGKMSREQFQRNMLDTAPPWVGAVGGTGMLALSAIEMAGLPLLGLGTAFTTTVGPRLPQLQQVGTTTLDAVSPAPLGFASPAHFAEFSATLSTGLGAAGARGTTAFLTGSAVSGANFRTGSGFDVGRISDLDVALVSTRLLNRASDLGLALRGGGTRTGPLDSSALKMLGLNSLQATLTKLAGRPVNFMVYQTEDALRRRGAAMVPFR